MSLMRLATRSIITLSLALLLVAPLAAADKQKEAKKRPAPSGRFVAAFLPKEIQTTLTEEQKEKITALGKEFGPKLAEIAKKRAGILTDEQKHAQAHAMKAAIEAGKKGREMMDAVKAAVQLTDEQKQQMKDLQKEATPLQTEVRKKVIALLTDEQKAKLPKRPAKKEAHAENKAKGEKKNAKEEKK